MSDSPRLSLGLGTSGRRSPADREPWKCRDRAGGYASILAEDHGQRLIVDVDIAARRRLAADVEGVGDGKDGLEVRNPAPISAEPPPGCQKFDREGVGFRFLTLVRRIRLAQADRHVAPAAAEPVLRGRDVMGTEEMAEFVGDGKPLPPAPEAWLTRMAPQSRFGSVISAPSMFFSAATLISTISSARAMASTGTGPACRRSCAMMASASLPGWRRVVERHAVEDDRVTAGPAGEEVLHHRIQQLTVRPDRGRAPAGTCRCTRHRRRAI